MDYELLKWICHKSYLLELQKCGVPIVPSVIIISSLPGSRKPCLHDTDADAMAAENDVISHERIDQQSTGTRIVSADSSSPTPGKIKRLMELNLWHDAILKPAVGSRCEGVLRLQLTGWDLATAMEVQALLSIGDCVLQPFISPVRHVVVSDSACGCDSTHGTNSNGSDHLKSTKSKRRRVEVTTQEGSISGGNVCELWSEVCVVVVRGELVHAVHKHPSQWGWHRPHCPCASLGASLPQSVCLCDALRQCQTVSRCRDLPATTKSSTVCVHSVGEQLNSLLSRAPVESLCISCLPVGLTDAVKAAVAAIPTGIPVLCRVDLLPRAIGCGEEGCKDEDGRVEWLVSEIEGQWCECFLRAATTNTISLVAMALSGKG